MREDMDESSKDTEVNPKITAEYIKNLLRKKFEGCRYACAAEVGNSTGGDCKRHIDFMVMNLWPSEGYRIEGFEIKISRSDMRRELQDPEKHNIFFEDIDTFTLVCPTNVIDMSITPPKWGVMAVENGELKVVRKPLALRDDHKEGLHHGFVASLMRSVSTQSLMQSVMNDRLQEEFKRGFSEGKESVAHGRKVLSLYEYEQFLWMKKFCSEIGIHSEWQTKEFSEGMKKLRDTICAFSCMENDLKYAEDKIARIRKAFYSASAAKQLVAEIERQKDEEIQPESSIQLENI